MYLALYIIVNINYHSNLFNYFIILCRVCFAHVYILCTMYMQYPQRPEESIRSPKPGITDCFELTIWVLVIKLVSFGRALNY